MRAWTIFPVLGWLGSATSENRTEASAALASFTEELGGLVLAAVDVNSSSWAEAAAAAAAHEAAAAVSVGEPRSAPSPSWSPALAPAVSGDIDKWIGEMRFNVKDGTIPDILGFAFKAWSCGNISFGSLEDVASPADRALGWWSVRARDVKVICSGLVQRGAATLHATISTETGAAAAQLQLTSELQIAPPVPDSLTLGACELDLALEVHVDGLPVPFVPKLLNEWLNKTVCDALEAKIEEDLSDYLLTAALAAGPIMQTEPLPTPLWNDSYASLEDEPIIQWMQVARQATGQMPEAIRSVLEALYPPSGAVCLVAAPGASPNFCLVGKDPICLLGASNAAGCLEKHSFGPGVQLRVYLTGAELLLGDTTLGLEEVFENEGGVNGTVLPLLLDSTSLDIVANISVELNASVGGVEGSRLGGNMALRIRVDKAMLRGVVNAMLSRHNFDPIPEFRRVVLGCLFSAHAVTSIQALDFGANFTIGNATLDLLGQLLPGQPPSKVLAGGVDVLSGALAAIFGVAGPAVAPLVQGAMRMYALEKADKYLATWLHKEEAHAKCPAPFEDTTWDGSDQKMIDPAFASRCFELAALLGGAGCLIGVVLGLCRCLRGAQASEVGAPLLPTAEAREVAPELYRLDSSFGSGGALGFGSECAVVRPLCCSECVPRSIALAAPLLLCALLAFLLGSNYMQLAETYVDLTAPYQESAGGGPVRLYQVMIYSLWFSVYELREQAHLPTLANVVLGFSGVLPYTKLILMLACWVMPMPRKIRGTVLLVMDQIGKYSLVDIFVIQFLAGCLHAAIPVDTRLGTDGPSIVMKSNQTSGFNAFVMATVGSLIIGHVLLYFHKEDYVRAVKDGAARPPLERPAGWGARAVLVLLTGAFLVGICVPCFTVELETPFFPLANNTYSLVGFSWYLPTLAEEPRSAATGFGQAVFVIFSICTIFGHLVLLLCYHFKVFRASRLAAICARTLAAWSCLDVVVMSLFVTLLEMETTDLVQLHDSGRQLVAKIKGIDWHHVPDNGLTVNVELLAGAYILATVSVLHWVVRPWVMDPLDAAAAAAAED